MKYLIIFLSSDLLKNLCNPNSSHNIAGPRQLGLASVVATSSGGRRRRRDGAKCINIKFTELFCSNVPNTHTYDGDDADVGFESR